MYGRLTDEQHIIDFKNANRLGNITKFYRSERLDSRGHKRYWNYECNICSNDEYVKAGLCSGVFEVEQQSLKIGTLSCRCSGKYRWTTLQREFQIKKLMNHENYKYSFSGWVDSEGYKNHFSKLYYNCLEHGKQSVRVNDFLGGKRCPNCAGKTQRQAYVNVVYDNGDPVALKFGIAVDSKQRVKQQNRLNVFKMTQILIYEFKSVEDCKLAEIECRRTLPRSWITKRELKQGFTETTALNNLDKIVQIFKLFGGVQIFKNCC